MVTVMPGPKVKEAFAKVRGCEIFYQRLGQGWPTILVHGGMVLDSSNFLPHVAPLGEFCDLVIYDQCGRGRSKEREGHDKSKATIWDDVEDLEGLRKALDLGKVNVIGHSWGGIIAGLFASKYPGSVNKLVMIAPVGARYATWQKPWITNTMNFLPPKDKVEFDLVLKNRELRKKDPQAYFTRYFTSIHKSWFGDQTWADKIPIHKVRAGTGLAVWDSLRDYDVREELGKIKAPTFIIQGSNDAIPIDSTKEIQGQIKNAQLEIIEGVGHYPFIEAKTRFVTLLRDFLTANIKILVPV
jgi:proline iminopeptidase